jgi:hypothetical protein
MSQIDIVVIAQIKKYNKKFDTLSKTHSIVFNLSEHTTNFIDMHMKMVDDNYMLYVLGKNGEAVPKT